METMAKNGERYAYNNDSCDNTVGRNIVSVLNAIKQGRIVGIVHSACDM
jgi:hypothetical protein